MNRFEEAEAIEKMAKDIWAQAEKHSAVANKILDALQAMEQAGYENQPVIDYFGEWLNEERANQEKLEEQFFALQNRANRLRACDEEIPY